MTKILDENRTVWVAVLNDEHNYVPLTATFKYLYKGPNALPSFETREECAEWCKNHPNKDKPVITTIEQAAIEYATNRYEGILVNPMEHMDGTNAMNSFITGAKSEAARDYWFKEFKIDI